MSLRDLLLCCLFAVIMPTGQVMFKWAALTHARLDGALQSEERVGRLETVWRRRCGGGSRD